MENLSSDIVLDILSRLPKTTYTDIETVLQCREVCKLWNSLLEKPNKGILFVSQLWSSIKLYYYREESSEMVTEEPQSFYKMVREISSIQTGGERFNFVGTCNGLVCYIISEYAYIYNPITGERIRVLIIFKGSLCDPFGFGYCRSTNTYKIVRIARGSKKGKQSVKVYTLGDGGGWRDKPEITYEFSESGVFANGALHWVINKRSPSNCDIVAFDLAEESFRSIPPPPCHPKSFNDVNLGCCGSNIYMCHLYTKKREDKMDIWVFEKKNMNNCRISLEERTWIRRFSGKREKSFLTRLLSRTETEILIWQNDALSCYDSTTFKKIWCTEAAKGAVSEAIPHMHSLVSLKHLGEERVDHVVLP